MECNGIEKSVTEIESGNGEYDELIDLRASSRGHNGLSFRPKRSGVDKSIIETKSGNGEYSEFIDLSTSSRGQVLLSLRAGTACTLEGVNEKINSINTPLNERGSGTREVSARRPVLSKTGLGKKSPHGPLKTEYGKLAFTLVELIVVIVIVGVLATVGFLAFANYPKQARDTVRITHLREIEKGLEFYKIREGDYPIPTNAQTGAIEGHSGIVWYKGTFGEDIISQIPEITKLPTDPKDNSEYTYELTENLQSYKLGTTLEIKDKNTGTKEYTTKNKLNIYWDELDPNCNKPEIHIGGQVWAGCNSTIGNGVEYYSEVTNCYDYSGNPVTLTTENGLNICKDPAYMGSNISAVKYYNKVKTANSIPEVDNIWGKLYYWKDAKNTACGGEGSGWRLPTNEDWKKLLTYLGCNDVIFDHISSNTPNNTKRCIGFGRADYANPKSLVNRLQIPLSGVNNIYRGYTVDIWTSTKTNSNFSYVGFNFGGSNLFLNLNPYNPNYKFSARCIKD